MPKKKKSSAASNVQTLSVKLEGITPAMTDRFIGENLQVPPEEKLYFDPKDGKTVGIPAANLMSFLTGENSGKSCAAQFGGKAWKKLAKLVQGYVMISPDFIPMKRGKAGPIIFAGFNGEGIYVDKRTARVKGGVPVQTERPVIEMPWDIEFKLHIFPNDEGVNEALLYNWFTRGGFGVALLNNRPSYGRFEVIKWE